MSSIYKDVAKLIMKVFTIIKMIINIIINFNKKKIYPVCSDEPAGSEQHDDKSGQVDSATDEGRVKLDAFPLVRNTHLKITYTFFYFIQQTLFVCNVDI